MTQCPCGSQNDYSTCCGFLIDSQNDAVNPEALMRSRYTAYSQAKTDYIKKTMRGKPLEGFDEIAAANWAKQVNWMGLKIIDSAIDENDENTGYVEFIASFLERGKNQSIHERSKFQRFDGKWFYTEGTQSNVKAAVKKTEISRNAPCPCGSQKKYKNCHGMSSSYN